ncbi:MAG: hypothetical protein MUC57_02610 [Desulfobacterales bacterium]|jgi:hypothetical protein|nr:hypothetical protein [Desulfobacterales bacterium]
MTPFETFERMLADTERGMISGLTSPARIQAFLDDIAYSTDDFYRCPLRVLRERTAHCFDGAVFAAAALRRLGHPPLILDLLSNGRDDEHLLALFKIDGHWGAVAKSNFVGLRFREPVYRNLRELAMSYFEQYYNIEREKTLRGYTGPLNLNRFDRFDWMTKDEPLDLIARRTDEIRRINLLPPALADRLSPVDERSYQAGLAGANPRGLFKPSQ